MHCFTGSQKFAEKLLNFNSFFLQVALLLLKMHLNYKKHLNFLPANRILIETDSPFLAPVPTEGKK